MKAKNEKKLIRVLLIRLNYQIILEILSRSIALYRSGKSQRLSRQRQISLLRRERKDRQTLRIINEIKMVRRESITISISQTGLRRVYCSQQTVIRLVTLIKR